MKIALFSLTLLLILAIPGLAISAQGPTETPTPTLRPIPPTPTSVYLYLRPTPTLLTVVPQGLVINFNTDPTLVADLTINMYRYFNKDHLMDLLASIMLAFVGVGILIKLIGRQTTET